MYSWLAPASTNRAPRRRASWRAQVTAARLREEPSTPTTTVGRIVSCLEVRWAFALIGFSSPGVCFETPPAACRRSGPDGARSRVFGPEPDASPVPAERRQKVPRAAAQVLYDRTASGVDVCLARRLSCRTHTSSSEWER